MALINISSAQMLVCDTARIDSLRNCGKFDYNSELAQVSEPSLLDRILSSIDDMFRNMVGQSSGSDDFNRIWVIVTIIILLIILFIIIRKFPRLFDKKSEEIIDYDVVEEDIYGIDFDDQISKFLNKKNYSEACRYLYLKTLYILAEKDRIDWQPNKTPTQFTREERSAEFKELTNMFLRVRYGKFDASSRTFEVMKSLVEVMDSLPSVIDEKGGEL